MGKIEHGDRVSFRVLVGEEANGDVDVFEQSAALLTTKEF
jgi:hypothetical protein